MGYDIVKKVNLFFRSATKKDIEKIIENAAFSDRQKEILTCIMYAGRM